MSAAAFIAVRRDFAQLLGRGRNDAAALLTRIVYFQHQKGRAVYLAERETLEVLNVTRSGYLSARRHLRETGLLIERHGFRKLVHFEIDLHELDRRLAAAGLGGAAQTDEISSPDSGDLNDSVRRIPAISYLKSLDTKESFERRPFAQTRKDSRKTASPFQNKKGLELVAVHRSWTATDSAGENVDVPVKMLHDIADAYRQRWPKQAHASWARLKFVEALRDGITRQEFEEAFAAGLDDLEERADGDTDRWLPNLGHWLETRLPEAVEMLRLNAALREREAARRATAPQPAPVAASPPAAAEYYRHGAARQDEDPDTRRWRARGAELMRGEPARPSPQPEAARPEPAPPTDHRHEVTRPVHAGVEAARRIDLQRTGDDAMASKFDPLAETAPEATPPTPEPARPASEPSPPPPEPEAALAAGERVLSHSEHMLLIAAGQCGPAPARGERRSAWPEHLRDAPKPLPAPGQTMTFSEHMAFLDHQRAERAARRAERCAARRRPAPQTGAFA